MELCPGSFVPKRGSKTIRIEVGRFQFVQVDDPEAMRKGLILEKTKTTTHSYLDKIEQNLIRTSLILQISVKFKQDTTSQSI